MNKSLVVKGLLVAWLLLFLAYVFGSTANFNRGVFGGLGAIFIMWFLAFIALFVLFSIFLSYTKNQIYFAVLLVVCFMTTWYMVTQFSNPSFYKGWLYPDVRVTRTKYNKSAKIYYRFTTKNFLQDDKKFYLEFKSNPEADFTRIRLPYLPRIGSYSRTVDAYNEQGERLISDGLRFGITEKNDSMFFFLSEGVSANMFFVELGFKRLKFIGNKNGKISVIKPDSTNNSNSKKEKGVELLQIYEKGDTSNIILNDSTI